MGRLRRLLGLEKRSADPTGVRLSDPYLASVFGMPHGSGPLVTPESAQAQVATLFACVNLISSALAGANLEVLERHSGGLEPVDDPDLLHLLNSEPNEGQTAFEAREMLLRDLLLTGDGNAYARVEHDGRGRLSALRPYPAGWITVERVRTTGRLRYRITNPAGGSQVLIAEEMMHVRGPTRDALLGKGPIALASGAVALVMAQSDVAKTQAERGFLPLLSFQTPGELSQDQYDRLRDGLAQMINSMGRRNVPLVAESNMKAERLSATSQEADFMAARKLGLQDIARLYNIPLSTVGLAERAPYATAEAEARAFVNHALRPWAKRLEQALVRAVFSPERRRRIVIKHDLDELSLGDIEDRFKAYAVAVTNSILCPDEVRDVEGWGPRPDGRGKEFIRPLNMAVASAPPAGG